MLIKVCGIKDIKNIRFLSKADIDMIGLNFYKPSIRYISEDVPPMLFDVLPNDIKRVGVFVNEDAKKIRSIIKMYNLDYIQLHGDEDYGFCNRIAEVIPIIKVFRIDDSFNFDTVNEFKSAEYFLFDTQTKEYGGSGKKFNWHMLDQYHGDIPFLLSGGIGPDDHESLAQFAHPSFVGIDINSKFESEPGIKDINLLNPFISLIKSIH